MTETFSDLLNRTFGVNEAELMQALKMLPADQSPLLVALRRITHGVPRVPDASSMLTESQVSLLERGGLRMGGNTASAAIAATELVAAHATLVTTAYTTAQVAEMLGVRDSRVRQRRADRTLWAIQSGNEYLFPAMQFIDFQFVTDSPRRSQIRGLDRVLPALPESLHPLSVAGFLTTPQPGLIRKGELVTPLEWLSTGGDPQPVLDAAHTVQWAGL